MPPADSATRSPVVADRNRTAERGNASDHASTPASDALGRAGKASEVSKLPWGYILRRMLREFIADRCPDLAASLTYHFVLSLFPGLLAVLSLLGLFGKAKDTITTALDIGRVFGSDAIVDTISGPLKEMIETPAAGIAFVTGLIVALWSASAYVGSFGRAMNRIYGIAEGRPFWKLRPTMLLVTAITVVLAVIVGLVLVLSGPVAKALGEALGLGDTTLDVWNVVKWPILAVVAILIVGNLYYFAPNVRRVRVPWLSPGAVLAILVWAAASAGFGFYVANFSKYSNTYGSLAGIVVFLLWAWISNMALLLGAEFDVEFERGRELRKGRMAEENLQLPLRDVTKINKARDKRAADILNGREIRERATPHDMKKRRAKRRK